MKSILEYYGIEKSQDEVDFLIPFLDIDRRFFIDPAQIRFSTEKLYKEWQRLIDQYINIVNKAILAGDEKRLQSLLNIGESRDVALGYCRDGHKGSGVGAEISRHAILVMTGKDFREKGLERLEEIQWLDKNIGPDRVGDLVANILKSRIVEYTSKQAALNHIPTRKCWLNKVFDFEDEQWTRMKVEVPINETLVVRDALCPYPPVLLLPKDVLKPLPLFMSYDDFYGFVDPDYRSGKKKSRLAKETVVLRVLNNPQLSSNYIKHRENSVDAKLYGANFNDRCIELIEVIESIPLGAKGKQANEYRAAINELLEIIFDGDLSLAHEEKATLTRESRRDGIFYNRGHSDIFRTFAAQHGAHHIIVDAKNTNSVTSKDVAEVSNYLDDNTGRVAIIVSRKKQPNLTAHQAAQKNRHHNIVIHLTDEDLKRWVTQITRYKFTSGEQAQRYSPLRSLEKKYSDIIAM